MDDRRSDGPGDSDEPQRDRRDGRDGPDERDRGGSDTQFVQLEMSRVLYGEAQGVTKRAFRELLLDAAKDHLRKRFGDAITRLAEMATDEMLSDIDASLEIENQIQRRQESSGGTPDRLREALARTASARPGPAAKATQGRASAARKRRR